MNMPLQEDLVDIEKPLDDSGFMELFNEFTQGLETFGARDTYIKTHNVIVANGDPKFNEYLFAPQHARLQETDVSDYLVLPSCLLGSDQPVNYWAVPKDKKPISFFNSHHDFSLFGFVGFNLPTNKKPDFVYVVNSIRAAFKLSACGLPCVLVPIANISGADMNAAQREAFKAVICALEKEGVKTYAPVAAHGVSTLKTLLVGFHTTIISLPEDIGTDIEDKVLIEYLDEVKAAADQQKWSELLPLREPESAPPAYPVQAFPKLAQDAIEAIAYHVQAPVGLAGQCVLGTMAYVAQIHVNAPDHHKPNGMPCSLFILTEGASGDRKSGCHNLADKVIKELEKHRIIEYQQQTKEFNDGVAACTNKKQTSEFIENNTLPPNPKSIFSDATIEPIAGAFIAGDIKNGAWASDEAGQFFGGSTMKGDTAKSAIGALTRVFDSGTFERTRAKSNSEAGGTAFDIRLMVNLLGQREVLHSALNDPTLRGQGFLPRFIFAAPQSLAGTRINTIEKLSEQSYCDPRLQRFWEHYGAFLPDPTDPISKQDHQEIESNPRHVLQLTDQALNTWLSFYNEVELGQKQGGVYESMTAFAGRAGELARRVATVFAFFERQTEISHNSMKGACDLVRYSLNEWLRYADVSVIDKKTHQAHQLSTWLVKTCTAKGVRELERRFVMANVTPKAIRQKDAFKSALSLLVEHHHVMHDDRIIMLNPALFI